MSMILTKVQRCIATRFVLAILIQLASLVTEASPQTPQTIVVPSEYENSPAPGSDLSFGSTGRFLSYYRFGELMEAMPEGGLISEVSFRLNENITFLRAGSVPDIEVRLSTAARADLDRALPFSLHTGQDETVVFPRGAVSFGEILSPWDPRRFDITLKFKETFFYDPRMGHLAFDLRIYERSNRRLELDTGGGLVIVGGIDSEFPTAIAGRLVTQLGYTAIPEPSTIALLFLGAFAIGAKVWIGRPKRKRGQSLYNFICANLPSKRECLDVFPIATFHRFG